jgi:hypothetical protein
MRVKRNPGGNGEDSNSLLAGLESAALPVALHSRMVPAAGIEPAGAEF